MDYKYGGQPKAANASVEQDESHGLARVNVSHLIIPTIGLFPVM